MISILKKMFEAHPGKSTIDIKDICSDCGKVTIISVTQTSGGFGLNGGFLFKSKADGYFVKCTDCYKSKQPFNRSSFSFL
jgi:ribosomal protein S27E